MGSTHATFARYYWDNVPYAGWILIFFVSLIIYSKVVNGLWRRNEKTRKAGYWLKGIFWAFWCLVVLWKSGLFGNFHFNTSNANNQTLGVGFSWGPWSWVKLAFSFITFVLAWLCLRTALKASFFRDWRFTTIKDKPYWHGPYWPGVIFVLGFFPCLIWMIWSPTWYLVPVMLLFWRVGSWPVGRKVTERWVPQFNEYLFPTQDSEEEFGTCYFYGKEAPGMNLFQLLVGIPFCLPLSSLTVLSWENVDISTPTGLIPTDDGSMVDVSVRLRMLTCTHPSTVITLSPDERQSSVVGSVAIAINYVPDLVARLPQLNLRSKIDEDFNLPQYPMPVTDPRKPPKKESMNDRIKREVLLNKGHLVVGIDFGAPIPAKAIAEAMERASAAKLNEGTTITNAHAAAKALEIDTEAKVASQQKLFMGEADVLVERSKADGKPISLERAMEIVIARHQADATRTVIAPGVGMTTNINPQQP